MHSEHIPGDWAALGGAVRQRWNRLTEDDLEAIDGERQKLLHTLERRYTSVPADTLARQVEDFEASLAEADDSGDAQADGAGEAEEEDALADARASGDGPTPERSPGGRTARRREPGRRPEAPRR